MRTIEKLIILILIVSAFSSHILGSVLAITNADLGIQWLFSRVNAMIAGILLALAVMTAILHLNKNQKTPSDAGYNASQLIRPLEFNILDLLVIFFFFGIGSFAFIVGFIRGNSLSYAIGDAYIYLSFGLTYFLSAFFVSKQGIFKIIDFIVYFIFIFIMIPETIYKFSQYFSTSTFGASGLFYYLLPFIYFFCRYESENSKKMLYRLTVSAITTIFTLYRTLAFGMIAVVALSPILGKRLKRSYFKFMGIILFLLSILLTLHFAQILPIMGRYDLTYYYNSLFNPEWSDKRDARVTETVSALNTMSNDDLSYFWGMGHGAIADMTNDEGYEAVYQFDDSGGSLEEGKVHSIHFTPASVFFRTGLIGLAGFVSFLVFALIFLYERYSGSGHEENRLYSKIVLLIFVVSIIYSFSRYGIMNDLVLAAFLGLIRNPNFTSRNP
ncbi:MAG: hypothetical protein WC788_03925 [Candidatus Paceibacterota bacterium]|jgi:hypothetical protein